VSALSLVAAGLKAALRTPKFKGQQDHQLSNPTRASKGRASFLTACVHRRGGGAGGPLETTAVTDGRIHLTWEAESWEDVVAQTLRPAPSRQAVTSAQSHPQEGFPCSGTFAKDPLGRWPKHILPATGDG
jgi:hypothetical protein